MARLTVAEKVALYNAAWVAEKYTARMRPDSPLRKYALEAMAVCTKHGFQYKPEPKKKVKDGNRE